MLLRWHHTVEHAQTPNDGTSAAAEEINKAQLFQDALKEQQFLVDLDVQ